jgi:predicted ester cyclase
MNRMAAWGLAGLTAIMPAAGRAAKEKAPGIRAVERLDALLNAGKPDEAAALFAPDAMARALDGRSVSGRDAIRGWLASLAGFRADAGQRQAWEGGRVTWLASVSTDRYRALGVAPLAASCEATVRDGLIAALTLRLSAESRLKVAEAEAKEAEGTARAAFAPALAGDDLLAAAPDLSLAVADIVVAGGRVAARGSVAGTWTGVLLGVTGTGQPVSAGWTGWAKVADGTVTDAAVVVDRAALLGALGFTLTHPALVPPAPAKPSRKR